MPDTPIRPFKRVLVTGGTGFIGRHLAAALLPLSEEILVTSRGRDGTGGSLRTITVDLAQAGASLNLLKEVRPTTVFHLAGRRPIGADEDPARTIDLNVRAAAELVRECAVLGIDRVVLLGSAEEYGDQAMPVRENAPLRPRSIYGASKASMTLNALALHQTVQAPVVVVRPFSVYGPGGPLHMFVAEAADCAARGVPFRMTQGLQKRDLVYVGDVVQGLLAAATTEAAVGRVFNLGCGQSHAMRDVAATLWRISGTSSELRVGALERTSEDLSETLADISEAARTLGWQPRVGLEEGLRATWLAAVQDSQGRS